MKLSTPLRVWWIALFVKLVLGTLVPLSHDEAYYWVWSHHLQWSYFDHPGMVSWLFWLGHPLEPLAHAVRLPFVVFGHLVLLIWLKILDGVRCTDQQKTIWLLLMLSSPLVGLGSLLALPDTPLLFFSSFAILAFLRGLKSGRSTHFALSGCSFGLAFCSKYHAVVVAAAFFLWLGFSGNWRRLSWRHLLLFVGTGLIACVPVLYWNEENHWRSFAFQLQHGLGQSQWNPEWTLSYLGGEFIILFPLTVVAAWQARLDGVGRLLVFLAWTPLVFFLFSSFRGPVELNWPITAYPPLFALAVCGARNLRTLWSGVLIWSALGIFVLVHIFFPFLQNPTDKLNEVHYFDPVLPFAEKYEPLYLGTYQMASIFSYHYKKPYWKLFEISRHDLFDELETAPPNENHYFVIKETWVPLPAWLNPEEWSVHQVQEIPPKFELLEVEHR